MPHPTSTSVSTKFRLNRTLFWVFSLVALTLIIFATRSRSANPASGTLNPAGPNVVWDGTAVGGSSPEGETTCTPATCDPFTLTLSGTPANWVGKKAKIEVSWTDANNDYDVYIHKGTATGPIVASSAAGGGGPETLELDPNLAAVGTGAFVVNVVYWLVVPDQYHAVASVLGGQTTPTPTPTPTPVAGTTRFFNYYAPPGVATDAGEPTMGVNWQTENVPHPTGTGTQTFKNKNLDGSENLIKNGGTSNYYGGFLSYMLRITFDDCSSPADALFEQMPVTLPAAPRVFGDPILFTDHLTGRTFVNQLQGLTPAGSTMEFTDDDGDSFFPSEGGAPSCIDHETIGGGVFHSPVPPELPDPAPYPHAVYYCSQCVSNATSQLSVDGGITFPIQGNMFTAADCAGLHGHIKIAPDGTAYVPDKACSPAGVPFVFGGEASVAVSENNGLTWSVRPIPDATSDAGADDPSVGVSWCPPEPFPCDKAARSNTIYLGFMFTDGRPGIAKSTDKGVTWTAPVDVGAQVGVKHIAFPAVAVGDPDRAAFAFFGTTTAGSYSAPTFPGVWYLYVSTTYDGGATWTTQNVTPNDPIQRGGICGDGTCRNLLDFFDAVIDKQGRILLAGEDGCIDSCVNGPPNSFTAKAFITRQTGGKRMFAVYDTQTAEPTRPGAPKVSGGFDPGNTKVTLTWPTPDNGGSAITAYKVYRESTAAGPFTPALATLPANINTYVDMAFLSGDNYYVVTAVNAVGESPYCNPLLAQVVDDPTPCDLPFGLQVINDFNADGTDKDTGQNTPADPSVNARELYIAEPFLGAGVNKLIFTLKVAPSACPTPEACFNPPPNSQWFIVWNRHTPKPNFDRVYVAMRTNQAGATSFEYGDFGVALDPLNPNQNANTPVKVGDADSGSYDPATGIITLTISNSKLNAADGGYAANADLAGLNVRTYFNRPDPGQRSQNNASDITDDSSYTMVGNAFCSNPIVPISAVSGKTHGANAFDINLPLTGTPGIECRRGDGANRDNHHVFVKFSSPVTFTGAMVNGGGTVQSTSTSVDGKTVTVNLAGVPNATRLTITLLGVSDGVNASDVVVPMNVLLGDTNANGLTNSSDIAQTKAQTGRAAATSNFRTDVTVNAIINSSDIALVKSKTGTGLPGE